MTGAFDLDRGGATARLAERRLKLGGIVDRGAGLVGPGPLSGGEDEHDDECCCGDCSNQVLSSECLLVHLRSLSSRYCVCRFNGRIITPFAERNISDITYSMARGIRSAVR